MSPRRYVAACAISLAGLLVIAGHASAQDRGAQNRSGAPVDPHRGGTQFTEQDRQTTRDWYAQHQTNPPAGLRTKDRLSPDEESKLQPGRPLDPALQHRVHTVPSDLAHRLSPQPRDRRYVAIGGHVGIMDRTSHFLHDVIHLHDNPDTGRR